MAIKKCTTLILKDMIFYFKINDIIKVMFGNIHKYRQNSIIDKIVDFITVDCDEFNAENQILLKFEMWNALIEPVRIRVEDGNPIYDGDLIETSLKFLKWPLRNINYIENVKTFLNNLKRSYVFIFNIYHYFLELNCVGKLEVTIFQS